MPRAKTNFNYSAFSLISHSFSIFPNTLFYSPPRLTWVSPIFVSLQIDYVLRTEGGLSKYLLECKFMSLPESGLDDGQMTPDSVLEPAVSTRTSSGSCGFGDVGCLALACTATTEIVRKKRSSMSTYRTACRPVFSPVSEISAGLMNRRKGTPHRAPLY